MTNENRTALAVRPTRGGKRGKGPKRKLSGPPQRGEVGELTMSVPDER